MKMKRGRGRKYYWKGWRMDQPVAEWQLALPKVMCLKVKKRKEHTARVSTRLEWWVNAICKRLKQRSWPERGSYLCTWTWLDPVEWVFAFETFWDLHTLRHLFRPGVCLSTLPSTWDDSHSETDFCPNAWVKKGKRRKSSPGVISELVMKAKDNKSTEKWRGQLTGPEFFQVG